MFANISLQKRTRKAYKMETGAEIFKQHKWEKTSGR
uniref:Uncharacterized protein n=1 Tax=Arundo donax TaxID=35708 RepID=A0A0A8ZJG9_ARUDO